jgi:hypothetical protein
LASISGELPIKGKASLMMYYKKEWRLSKESMGSYVNPPLEEFPALADKEEPV